MSIETWKAEFYPVEARDVTPEQAVEHSLRKWRGLTDENLEKHGVHKDEVSIFDEDGKCFVIAANSCALCHHYINTIPDPCMSCPLAEFLGAPCDDGPYAPWSERSNPYPMIKALEGCYEVEKLNKGKV